MRRVANEARGLLGELSTILSASLSLKATHTFVASNHIHATELLKPHDAGMLPRGCSCRMFMEEVLAFGALLPVELGYESQMDFALSLPPCHFLLVDVPAAESGAWLRAYDPIGVSLMDLFLRKAPVALLGEVPR